MRYHFNRSRWLLRDTSPGGVQARRLSAVDLGAYGLPGDTRAPHWLARAMSLSDFCYSPLGQHHGDSDRYLPALLYGCIPVFVKEDEAGPFREALAWDEVSLRLSPHHVPELHVHLARVPHERVVSMRRAMARWWARMLWPAVDEATGAIQRGHAQRAFAAERTRDDAFTTLAEVLRGRLARDDRRCAPGSPHESRGPAPGRYSSRYS